MLKIITHPNPILRQKAKPIKDISTEEIQALIPELADLMLKSDGLGIAAPQVAKSIRLIIVRYKDDNLALLNPKIISKSILKEIDEEGCLSVPNVYGQVKRCKKITVKFQDTQGKMRKMTGEGLFARVIQHEVDHLDGVLFIDKAKNLRKGDND
ncbi:MAG: peptide deformylase [Candidatus Buchananbacteria bacterium]|jgi:peptide deformylase